MKKDIVDGLYEQIVKMPVIDTHEHLPINELDDYADRDDILKAYLSHYMRSDLISAGMSQKNMQYVTDASHNILQRWDVVEPYWEFSRNTGYARALDISVQKIYGFNRIDRNTIKDLGEAYLKEYDGNHTNRVLKDICGITISVLDHASDITLEPTPLFIRAWQPQEFICPSQYTRRTLPNSLEEFISTMREKMQYALACHKSRILKCAIAYSRNLDFDDVDFNSARNLYSESKKNNTEFPIQLQDFMMHEILKYANENTLTIQFHTGLLEGNNGDVRQGDPFQLTPLFNKYPDVKFDLFHIGYPFGNSVISLCKTFPNVFADMCWAHIISPQFAKRFLREFLDAVPYNKLSAFGGDFMFVDGVYGHLEICRKNVAEVLSEMIVNGTVSASQAEDIAYAVFYGNPKQILQLDV